jgi:nucleoid-associated protein YgaU
MGIFDRKDDKPKGKPDFSNVQSGSSSTAPTPAVPTGTTGASSNRTYVVVKGDSLSKIAKREYGDAAKWSRIYEANKDIIKDPDLIYPGQTLKIPGA